MRSIHRPAVSKYLLLLLLVAPATAQEHAPTVDICRADAALWISQIKTDKIDSLSFNELINRQNEMRDCMVVDPESDTAPPQTTDSEEIYRAWEEHIKDQNRFDNYEALFAAYCAVSGKRMYDFLDRHGLSQQFLQEDSARKRQ